MNKISRWIRVQSLRASRKAESLIERAKMTEHFFMIAMAVLIGLLAGFGAVGIRMLIHYINDLSFPGDNSLLENIMALPWWWKMAVPAIGGAIVGPLIYWGAPEAKGHGVPEVMQAVLVRGGYIRPRVAIVKALASAVTIGTGGSVGREGPIIQIGSSLGSTVGQFFRVKSKRMKTLVGAGAAAGIAAAFNAPVAGALFALEIILMDYAVAQFTPIVIASVMATVVSHTFEGDFAAFQVPHYEIISRWEVGFYFILGLLSGLVSWLFIKVLYFFEELWDDKIKIPQYIKPTIGGILLGAIAIIFPQVMGIGYDTMDAAFHSQSIWWLALILIFVKILATSITLGSGGSGGIFAPSLFMGTMLGAFFGYIVNYLFPGQTAEAGAYALVAMGGLVAGTTRAPITAIIIVFELTKQTSIILPLMITCTISMIVSQKLSRESIYTLKLLLRNISIKGNSEVNIMRSLPVKDVYSRQMEKIRENANFNDIVSTILSKNSPFLAVEDMKGNFIGIISLDSIKEMLFEKDMLKDLVIAGDIAERHVPRININDNCRNALDKMGKCNYDALPVTSGENDSIIEGIVWRKDIDDAYQKEIEKIELTSDLATKITDANKEREVQFIEGQAISEFKAPDIFVGKSIREIGIRSNYGVEVLSIKNQTESGYSLKAIPHADYVIKHNDNLVVAGEIEKINILKHL
jgi:CIC family chloride channel protein